MSEYTITPRNKVKRVPYRENYNKEAVHEILDAGFVCHVGFNVNNQPFVIPTLYGRKGDCIYIHGASSSRMLRHLQEGIEVCITVTHVDGLVLARSAFHHSMNYRSVVVFGKAFEVFGEEKNEALKIISDQIINGRWEEVREPSPKELKATSVLKVRIDQASAKVRTGPPVDDKPDYDLNIWAGVLPFETKIGIPVPDDQLNESIPVSKSVDNYYHINN